MDSKNSGFSVVDVETTGFGKHDRVIEIGVVTLNAKYEVLDEYETLIDPQRDLGPTHVHGIKPSMVSMAPTFDEVAQSLAARLANRVVVAHNLTFDTRMLTQEYRRIKATCQPGSGICTLKLTRQKLPAACQQLGIEPPCHHRALEDARACANILKTLQPRVHSSPLMLAEVPGEFSVRTHRRPPEAEASVFDRLRGRIVFDEGDTRLVQYMDLLDWVLDDLVLTSAEQKSLNAFAKQFDLSRDEVSKAHLQYFQAMVAGAEKDGVITKEEYESLRFVAESLGISRELVPPPSPELSGFDQIPGGSAICFTGSFMDECGNQLPKVSLESMATHAGFRVVASVTKAGCDVVVAQDPCASSGKARNARKYGIPILALDDFLKLLSADK